MKIRRRRSDCVTHGVRDHPPPPAPAHLYLLQPQKKRRLSKNCGKEMSSSLLYDEIILNGRPLSDEAISKIQSDDSDAGSVAAPTSHLASHHNSSQQMAAIGFSSRHSYYSVVAFKAAAPPSPIMYLPRIQKIPAYAPEFMTITHRISSFASCILYVHQTLPYFKSNLAL